MSREKWKRNRERPWWLAWRDVVQG